MSGHEPLDFLLLRAERVSRRAAQLRHASEVRRSEAHAARLRAQAAMLRAAPYTRYARELARQSAALANRPRIAPDPAVRAWLTPDELRSRRVAKRLRRSFG